MDNELKILGIIIGGIGGVYAWLIKHIANAKKHPCKDDIDKKFEKVVFADVCNSERKRLDDCIEKAVERSNEQHKELKEDMKAEFAEVKELIRRRNSR